MNKSILVLMTIATQLIFATTTHAQSKDEAAVEKLVLQYFDALNASDTRKAVSLFTSDGVLLPSGAPTASGTEQLTGNYQYVFDHFTFQLKVTIENITVAGKYAYVRSTSLGSLGIKANGQTINDNFRELFVLQKEKGSWKISSYMYNQSK
ncbi:MAG TPA: SgcJ/EcaC family oxidoreductase [Saprospiraceae bacterium]|nr:SgcJ/EcaC family oxidoreductase [Saprospiraceae bacterium]